MGMIDDTIDVIEFCTPPVATMLVAATRNKLRSQRKRVIAVLASPNGGQFKVTAPIQPPPDFAEAVAEVMAPGHVPTVRMPVGVDDEKIGAEICEAPYKW